MMYVRGMVTLSRLLVRGKPKQFSREQFTFPDSVNAAPVSQLFLVTHDNIVIRSRLAWVLPFAGRHVQIRLILKAIVTSYPRY